MAKESAKLRRKMNESGSAISTSLVTTRTALAVTLWVEKLLDKDQERVKLNRLRLAFVSTLMEKLLTRFASRTAHAKTTV